MANAASRRRNRAKAKGSSKAGRPKQEGERYACGKLKPKGPNKELLARRQAGDAAAGEHPLDFALSKGWITEREHKDAMAYRAAFNRAHIAGPKLSSGSLQEAPESERLARKWAEMGDGEITEIFDRVFSSEASPEDRERAEETALARWKALNAALSRSEREELFMVCILGSWPFWMPKEAAGRDLGVRDLTKKHQLLGSLTAIGRAMRPPKAKPATITALPVAKRTRTGRAESIVRYETADGIEVEPTSEHGVPFEVAVLRRRAG